MARQVAWADTAWRDLERVVEYVAEDSPSYAAALARRIREVAGSLDELAERGRVVPELGDPQVRELLIGNCRLIYEVGTDTVNVFGLIHGARNLESLWADGPPEFRDS